MKKLITIFISICSFFPSFADVVEKGNVKEYRGKDVKTILAGVEVMVKGAPSTVSDEEGNFVLHFATLVAGDKIDCSEIYKNGYVIFNKDAVEAWRISNNGRPFTIVMCKEADFRALKKKFYGIIEKSYREDYEKQKALAEQLDIDKKGIEERLKKLEKEYNEKLGNINTYVELFSRIDRSEMDFAEEKSLEYMEAGEIDKAIAVYEELQISRQVEDQMSKWDAGTDLVSAGNTMIEQAKSDLLTLVERMQKQIGLYEMGGREYDEKRRALIDDIIPVLYRLNAISDGYYSETLGRLIIARSKWHEWEDRIADYREAAALPSAAGLAALGDRFEMMTINQPEFRDSIRSVYLHALELDTAGDTLLGIIKNRLVFVPLGVYRDENGYEFPFGLWGKNNSEAYLCGRSSYVSTRLEGDVKLPDRIVYQGKTYPVTAISNFAFGNNHSLKKVRLPDQLKFVAAESFVHCVALDTIVIPPTLDSFPENENMESVLVFPDGTDHIDWVIDRYDSFIDQHPDPAECTAAKNELLITMCRYFTKHKDVVAAAKCYGFLGENYLAVSDLTNAKLAAEEGIKQNGKHCEYLLGRVYEAMQDYDKAVLHLSRSTKEYIPYAYNRLAYMHAYPEYGRQNFKKAHEYIDKAIVQSAENRDILMNLLDSKGEIYLIEGKMKDAKKYHDTVIQMNPDFYTTTESVLHDYFSPKPEDDKLVDMDETANETEKISRIQFYIDIVQLVARNEHKKMSLDNFRSDVEYEELLSIGIIALQVIIKNKTPEELKRYNAIFLASAITWAIRNEIKIRYDWYHLTNRPSAYETSFREECQDTIHDEKWLNVEYAICLAFRDMLHSVQKQNHSGSSRQTELIVDLLQKKWDALLFLKMRMNDEQQRLFDYMVTPGVTVYDIEKRFDYDTISSTFLMLNEVLLAKDDIEFTEEDTGISGRQKDGSTGDIYDLIRQSHKNDVLGNYIDLLCLIASNEWKYTDMFGVDIDREEVLSIAIIAMQVIIKNKTPEELERYNSMYIAAAITWAIRNELSIRYEKYARCENKLKFNEESKETVRMHIYFIVKDLYYHGLENYSSALVYSSEIKEAMAMIEDVKNKLNGKQRSCADLFFDKSSLPQDIADAFTVDEINDMLDTVKNHLLTP